MWLVCCLDYTLLLSLSPFLSMEKEEKDGNLKLAFPVVRASQLTLPPPPLPLPQVLEIEPSAIAGPASPSPPPPPPPCFSPAVWFARLKPYAIGVAILLVLVACILLAVFFGQRDQGTHRMHSVGGMVVFVLIASAIVIAVCIYALSRPEDEVEELTGYFTRWWRGGGDGGGDLGKTERGT